MDVSKIQAMVEKAEDDAKKILTTLQEQTASKRVDVSVHHSTKFDGTEIICEVEVEVTY